MPKALVELTIYGDFDEDLDEDEIEEMVDMVIQSGCESYCLYGRVNVKEVLREEE